MRLSPWFFHSTPPLPAALGDFRNVSRGSPAGSRWLLVLFNTFQRLYLCAGDFLISYFILQILPLILCETKLYKRPAVVALELFFGFVMLFLRATIPI